MAPGLPAYEIRFETAATAGPDERVLAAVAVARDGREIQRLEVPEAQPLLPGDEFVVSTQDLDSDGYADLGVVTARGVANSYAEYWRFDPAPGRFVPLGRYPWLQPDREGRGLTAYERGGDDGRSYTSTRCVVDVGRLVADRVERQERDPRGSYRKVVEERRDGTLKPVSTTRVPAP